MGKYSKYVNNLRLWTEIVRPSYRGKIADFSLIFDQKVFPEAKIWVETFHVYAPGSGVMVPDELPIIVDGKELIFMVLNDSDVHPTYDIGIWVNTPFFASALQELFLLAWKTMKPAKEVMK